MRAAGVKVLYITAAGRSGSTIVGNTLGELDGFFHAGELRTLWGQGLIGGRLCGCGEPVRECPFWQRVLKRTLGTDGDSLDPAKINRQHEQMVRFRHLPQILRDERTEARDGIADYERVAARLYAAIGEEAEARVIVDSSKHPADAAILRRLRGIEPFFVHLVRDPRAVAYSWQRQKNSPGERSRQEMIRLTTTTSTRNWMVVNIAAEALRRKTPTTRSVLVRYESFVAHPRATIDRILRLLGEPRDDIPLVGDDHHVRLTPGHTAGGNPDRFRTGVVALREDREWLDRQRTADRLLSTALALPLLPRYGYPVFARTRTRSH